MPRSGSSAHVALGARLLAHAVVLDDRGCRVELSVWASPVRTLRAPAAGWGWEALGVFERLPGHLDWVFDLVAAEGVVRARALARHQELLAVADEAWSRQNALWAVEESSTPSGPHLLAAMDQARAEFNLYRRQTIFGPIDAVLESARSDVSARQMYCSYVVLYLQWEAEYPQDWAAPESSLWSPWGTKAALLDRFDRDGVPRDVCPPIRGLIVAALRRPYRCKDWMYARLVRHVLDRPFLGTVEKLCEAEDPLVRLRAQFVVHAAQNPQQRIKRTSWRRWLVSDAAP